MFRDRFARTRGVQACSCLSSHKIKENIRKLEMKGKEARSALSSVLVCHIHRVLQHIPVLAEAAVIRNSSKNKIEVFIYNLRTRHQTHLWPHITTRKLASLCSRSKLVMPVMPVLLMVGPYRWIAYPQTFSFRYRRKKVQTHLILHYIFIPSQSLHCRGLSLFVPYSRRSLTHLKDPSIGTC